MLAICKTSASVKIEHAATSNVPQRLQPHSPTEMEKQNVISRQDNWMRQCWNKTLSERLGVPDHYSHVAVLIVRWVKDLDYDLKCWEEASRDPSLGNENILIA